MIFFVTYSTTLTVAELKLNIELPKDTPYLMFTGARCSNYCDDQGENKD